MDKCTEKQFLRDIEKHQMIVIRDDGVNRHIRFKKPNSGNMYFDLITWKGHLCYTGDMGTYVFSRVDDMFEFFRTDREFLQTFGESRLCINPSYWGEKLLSESRFGGYREFDADHFKKVVNEYRVKWVRDMYERGCSKEDRRELWEEVEREVLWTLDDGEHAACQAAHNFQYTVRYDSGIFAKTKTYEFQDLFEHNFTSFSFHFIWCCYALAWGIQQYDNAKQLTEKQREE